MVQVSAAIDDPDNFDGPHRAWRPRPLGCRWRQAKAWLFCRRPSLSLRAERRFRAHCHGFTCRFSCRPLRDRFPSL